MPLRVGTAMNLREAIEHRNTGWQSRERNRDRQAPGPFAVCLHPIWSKQHRFQARWKPRPPKESESVCDTGRMADNLPFLKSLNDGCIDLV